MPEKVPFQVVAGPAYRASAEAQRESLLDRDLSVPVRWVRCPYRGCDYTEVRSCYTVVHLIQHHNLTETEGIKLLYDDMLSLAGNSDQQPPAKGGSQAVSDD